MSENAVVDNAENSVAEITPMDAALSVLTDKLRSRYNEVPKEYLEMSDEEIEKEFAFTKTDRMIRICLWKEIARAQEFSLPKINITKMLKGVCSAPTFFQHLLQNDIRVAYYLRPPQAYESQVGELIDIGVKKLREAFDAKLVYSNGHLDARAAKTLLDILAYFEDRTKGAIEQKIKMENKNSNVTVNITTPSMGELDKKLNELRNKLADYASVDLVHSLPERTVKDIDDI